MTDLDASRRSEGLSGRPIFLLRFTYPSLVDVLLLAELRTLGRTERERETISLQHPALTIQLTLVQSVR